MSLRFTIRRLVVPAVALFDPRRAASEAEAVLLPALEEASLYALRQIQDRAPVGATAQLRGSVQQATEIIRGTPVQFRGEVFTLAPHAQAVEEGTRPHWAPIRPLKLWSKRILGDEQIAWAVQRVIAKRGTKAHPFFGPGAEAARPRIEQILSAAWERYVSRLTGGK